MKRIYFLILIISAFALNGCEKSFLDKTSRSQFPGEFIETTEDGLELLITGTYHNMQSGNYYGGVLYLYEALKGPDFFQRVTTGGYSFASENAYSGGKNQTGNCPAAWTQIYNIVRNCTILIESIDNVTGDITHLRQLKAEAYALQALAYFDLLRLYSFPPRYSCPWGSAYNAKYKWGVPIIDTIDKGSNVLDYHTLIDEQGVLVFRKDDVDALPAEDRARINAAPDKVAQGIGRNTAAECWALVKDQMEKAQYMIKGIKSENGKINEAAILALRQRIALYMEDYVSAISLGEQWLAQFENNYSMLNYDSWESQYYKPFTSESIWELKFSEVDNRGPGSINYWARKQTYNIPGSPLDGKMSENIGYAKMGLTFGTSSSGYECLMAYPNDIRRYLICELGVPGTNWNSVRRYVGEPFHYVHNIPILRLPEIYLNLSEAYFKRGRVNEAIAMLAKVTLARRKEANPTITSINSILDERRREFIFEGQTYFDWFRNGRNIPSRPLLGYISSTEGIDFATKVQVVYPIPLLEMNANPAIRSQQNPGYGEWEFGIEDDDVL
ncbi:MAG TPA: RagB/SusD family nutrient uptake outer membrane protein [Candidatus Cryptobacteroides sp.]|nr:RagB/SusD family nutrient uptake outer membrane protein [Candidatus Cryptobacteroides sp.]